MSDILSDLGLAPEAETPKKKKKDDKEQYANEKLNSTCDKFLKAKQENKDSKASMDAAASKLAEGVENFRISSSEARGFAVTSVVVNNKVRVTVKGQYSMDVKEKAQVEKVFGDDFDKYVETKDSISLKSAFLTDKTKLAELIKAIGGAQKFREFFDIGRNYSVKDTFHEDFSTDKSFREKVAPLIEDGVLTRIKATVVPA